MKMLLSVLALVAAVLTAVVVPAPVTAAEDATIKEGDAGATESLGAITLGDGGEQVLATEWYKNVRTGRCLRGTIKYDVNTGTACNDASYRWYATRLSTGWVTLQNAHTKRCLFANKTLFYAHSETCDSTKTPQQWAVNRWDDGTISFRNRYSGYCIEDKPDLHAYMMWCEYPSGQKWY